MNGVGEENIIDRIARLERMVERFRECPERMEALEQGMARLEGANEAQRRWFISIVDAGGDPHLIESHGVTASLDFATFRRDGDEWDFPGPKQRALLSKLWCTIDSQIPLSLAALRQRMGTSRLDPASILRGTDSIGRLIHRRAGGYFIPRGKLHGAVSARHRRGEG